ncbi:hypothetical protein [Rhizobium oryziradicis]|nr:hypothetical protein [Rhizobium oryziradicis]
MKKQILGTGLAFQLLAMPCFAQTSNVGPSNTQIVQMGAQMYAAAELCLHYSRSNLEDVKQKQRKASEGLGVSATDFDLLFDQSYQDTVTKITALSASQKAQMCQKMNSIANGAAMKSP